jgi:hypothetical protein
MTLVGIGGNGRVVSLVLTGADCQVAKELEPIDAIHLAHRLIEEALAIRHETQPELRVALSEAERAALRHARHVAGIGVKPMARRLSLPVTTFNNYEMGVRRVPYTVLEAWRRALETE